MSESTRPCESDQVFLGLTRPPMFFGITDAYAVFMVVVVMIVFLGLGGIKGIAWGLFCCAPALYIFGYAMCERDPRIFQLWMVKLGHFSTGRRRQSFWGGASFDPAGRVAKPTHEAGLRLQVGKKMKAGAPPSGPFTSTPVARRA